MTFPRLFTPFTLKNVTLRNRIAISGHFAGWWVEDGMPGTAFASYVEERVKNNGVGLFVIGATSPQPGSGWMESVSDAIIPRYEKLVEVAHKHQAAIFAQLCHPGYHPLPGPAVHPGSPRADATQPAYTGPPRKVPSIDEVHELVYAFGEATRRAVAGGVDGMELHAHESFLHAQFLNPVWNTRTDEYGGSLENRLRFLVETLQAMRTHMPEGMPLGIRLKLDDMEQRGMAFEEFVTAAQLLEADGLADYINFTGGDGRFHHGPMARPDGEWLPLMQQMRQQVKLPLMHNGRITTPEMAEQAIAEGWVDVVGMTKTHICDPHFTAKVYASNLADIRYCTRCIQSCHGAIDRMTCVYNPLTSREAMPGWATLEPAVTKKRVVIVGAGPAGMEAAITLSARGHSVTVLEKSDRVGGLVWLGASSPMRQNWARIAEFYTRQAEKGTFDVRLNTEATPESVLALSPDAVIIATGSYPLRHPLPGGRESLTVNEVLAGATDGCERVLLYDREGFNRAMVAADYLSAQGIAVHFVSPNISIGETVEYMTRAEIVPRLQAQGVTFYPGEELEDWTEDGTAITRSVRTAEERTHEGIDAVVAMVGSRSINSLAQELRGRVSELHVIGDANLPQTVEAATYQGARLGRKL